MRGLSPLAVYGTLVVLVLFALGGTILIQPGPESTQRLGLFFGVVGTAVAAIVTMIRSDQSAKQTNGSLDDRIRLAVYQAMDTRRKGDSPAPGVPAAAPADPRIDPATAPAIES